MRVGHGAAYRWMMEESLFGYEVLEQNAIVPPVRQDGCGLAIQLGRPCREQAETRASKGLDREGHRDAHRIQITRAAGEISGGDAPIVLEDVAKQGNGGRGGFEA